MLRKLYGAAALLSLTLATTAAYAQVGGVRGGSAGGGGAGGTSGLFGSRSLGQSGGIQPSQSSLFGGTGGSASTRGGNNAASGLFQTNAPTMEQRSINAGRNLSQSFVGADAVDVTGVGTAGGGATTRLQGARGLQNQFGQNQFRQFDMLRQQFQNFNNLNQQNRPTQVRIALTLGFTPPTPPSTPTVTQTAMQVQRRLPRLPGVTLVENPQVLMEGRTAIVRGTVATERDRELVSRLLMLEPGVSSVRNELRVAQAVSGPGAPPSPPSAGQPEPPPPPPQS
jgi:hypothetical protein